jgi:hypothetical protein
LSDPKGEVPMKNKEARREISRRSFLKLGLAGISATALLIVAGCVGEEDDEGGDDDDDDDSSRRRRRRRR